MEARGLLCKFGLLLIVEERCFHPFVLVLTKVALSWGWRPCLLSRFVGSLCFNYVLFLFLVFVLVLFCLFVVLPVASPSIVYPPWRVPSLEGTR